jgi:hypothetical protein
MWLDLRSVGGAAYFIPALSFIDFAAAVCDTLLSYWGGVLYSDMRHSHCLFYVLYVLFSNTKLI